MLTQSLSHNPTAPANEQAADSYLLFRLGDEIYGIPGNTVREVMRWHPPTPVPGAPAALPGIISQRGVVMPVVYVHTLLGLPESSPDRATRYVVVHYDAVDMALLVDAVIDLVDLPDAVFEPLPTALDPQRARFLHALARLDEKPLAVINLATLIAALRVGD